MASEGIWRTRLASIDLSNGCRQPATSARLHAPGPRFLSSLHQRARDFRSASRCNRLILPHAPHSAPRQAPLNAQQWIGSQRQNHPRRRCKPALFLALARRARVVEVCMEMERAPRLERSVRLFSPASRGRRRSMEPCRHVGLGRNHLVEELAQFVTAGTDRLLALHP